MLYLFIFNKLNNKLNLHNKIIIKSAWNLFIVFNLDDLNWAEMSTLIFAN